MSKWPHRGGSERREPQKSFFKNFEKIIWSRNRCFSYGFPPNCDHFQCFPHTPMPPRPPKRPKNNDLLLDIFHKIIFLFFLRALGAIVLWCHRGAMPFFGTSNAIKAFNLPSKPKCGVRRAPGAKA